MTYPHQHGPQQHYPRPPQHGPQQPGLQQPGLQQPAGMGPRLPRCWGWLVAVAVLLVVGIGLVITVLTGQSGDDTNGNNAVTATRNTDAAPTPTDADGPPITVPGQDDPGTGPQVNGLPEPTGAEVTEFAALTIGDCVEARILPDKTVNMYGADCEDATFVLDGVVPGDECPLSGSAGVGATDGLTYCFAWVLELGDCFILDLWYADSCEAVDTLDADFYTVLDIKFGDTVGTRCEDPDQYVQSGFGPSRGVACYSTTG